MKIEPRSSGTATSPQVSELPSTIQAVIAARLEQLSPPARELVSVAAVIGRAFDFNVLLHACNKEEDILVRGLDELWQRRIVREQGMDAYDFSHDKLREGAYAALSTVRRRLLHRRVAEALEEVYVSNLDAVSGQIATHFEQADLLKQAIPYYRRAAEIARQVYANDMAIDYYHHLLPLVEEQKQGRVMLALGTVLRLTGQWTEAEAIYHQALSTAGVVGDLHTQAEIQQALGDVIRLRGAYDVALDWLEQAQIGFQRLDDQQGLIRTLWTMGEVYWYQGNFAQALIALEHQMQVATAIGDRRGMCDAAGTMGIVYWSQGDYPQALACCEQSLQIAKEIDHQYGISRAALTIGNVYLSEGIYLDALAWYIQALQVATAIGDRQGVGFAIGCMGNAYLSQGDSPRALKCFEHAFRIANELGDWWAASIEIMNISDIYIKQGRFNEAEHLCIQGIALGRALRTPSFLCAYLYANADLYARQQRYAEAEQLNSEALGLSIQVGNVQLGEENVQFSAQVLSIRLSVALHQIDVPTAISELEKMLHEWLKDEEQAMVQYEIWRLDTFQELYRQNAASLYGTMYTRAPKVDYRQRYEELTGERLPKAPSLPELPEIIRDHPVDLEILLAQIDQAITDLQAGKEEPR